MQPQQSPSISTVVIFVTLGLSSSLIWGDSQFAAVLAQNPPTVKIDNLTRMAPINQVLKQQYEAQFPEQSIQVKTPPAPSNLQSLQNQQSDLTAVSRLLTAEEQAQGLVQIPVTREKIAIVVGKENPFAQGLTIDQVVKIFRGDITDWSQIGGEPSPIKVIHRPIANNLQGTLQTYDLFGPSTFDASSNTVQLEQDSVTALTAELGSDGISYALASQILNAQDVRPISMYQTLPDNPKYPFSQPFTYVYQEKPSASTQNFLDYVASELGQQAIAQAKTTISSDLPSSTSASTSASELDSRPSSSNNSQSNSTDNLARSASDADNGETQDSSGGFGWLPIGLLVLVLGGVAGGVLKTILAKKRQPQAPPRPAPNYAERIKPTTLDNPSTQLQEPSADLDSIASIPEAESPLRSPENLSLGATAGAAVIASDIANPPPAESESESPLSADNDIPSPELKSQTFLQGPKTELQDTSLSEPASQTQLPNETGAERQSFDDIEWIQDEVFPEDMDLSSPPLTDSNPTKLQDPGATRLQEPQSLWTQDEAFPENIEPSSPPLTDSNPTKLQDLEATRLQDPGATQLQESNPEKTLDPKQTWIQDEAFPENIDLNSPPLTDSNPTKLQDPGATRLQDSNPEKTLDPKQTWIQEDEAFPENIDLNSPPLTDSNPTKLQDPEATRLQDSNPEKTLDPKQTWIQEDEAFPENIDLNSPPLTDSNPTKPQDPGATRLQDSNPEKTIDPKQTWIQEDEN